MSETEVIETDAPPTDVDAVSAINSIREAARAEFKNENEHLTKQVGLLSQEIDKLATRLEPLEKFEFVLKKNIKSPLEIKLYNLSEFQRKLLCVFAEKWYPEQRKRFDSDITDISPINRMFSDLTMKLVESGYESCWLLQLLHGSQFIVRDGV